MLGDPVTDSRLALEVDYFRLARDRYFVPIIAKIPGSELELARHGGADSTKIDFIGVVKDAAGKVSRQRPRLRAIQAEGCDRRHSSRSGRRRTTRLHPPARRLLPPVRRARKYHRQDRNLRHQIRRSGPDH